MGSSWTETGYVFIREDGNPVGEGTVTQLFIKLLKRAGLRHNRLHDLRHLHATELLRLGEPLHVVSKRLGHADLWLRQRSTHMYQMSKRIQPLPPLPIALTWLK